MLLRVARLWWLVEGDVCAVRVFANGVRHGGASSQNIVSLCGYTRSSGERYEYQEKPALLRTSAWRIAKSGTRRDPMEALVRTRR